MSDQAQRPRKVSRRGFMRGLALAGGGALLAACQPRTVIVREEVPVTQIVKETVKETVVVEGTPQIVEKEVTKVVEKVITATPVPTPAEEVDVGWVGMGAVTAAKEYERTTEVFNERFPHVHATFAHLPGDYNQQLQTMIAAEAEPDVLSMPAGLFAQYKDKGVLLSLEPFIAEDPTFDKNDFFDAPREAFTYQGELYALPAYGGPLVTYWNMDAFEEAGLDPLPASVAEADNWDLTAMVEAANALTQRDGNLVTRWGYVLEEWDLWVTDFGAKVLNDDYTECLLDSDEAIAALQWMQDFMYVHQSTPTPEMAEQADNQMFMSGRVGFIVERRWVADFFVDQGVALPWKIAPLPKGPTGRKSTTSSWGLSVSARTEHPQEAWELADWLMSKEGILTIGIYGVPQRKSVVASKVFLEDTVSPEENQIFVDEMPESVFMPPITPLWAQITNEAINPQLDRLWANEASGEEVAVAIVEKANEILQSA